MLEDNIFHILLEKKNQGVILYPKVYMEKHKYGQIKMFLYETEGVWHQ